jgi:glycosyltransferase involved in cell wall biosynthesis
MSLATPLKVPGIHRSRLPVISIKTPLMKSIIEHNDLGLLCPYRARDIAAGISQMHKMPEDEYQAMSQRCTAIAQARFNWESLEPALFSLLDSLK